MSELEDKVRKAMESAPGAKWSVRSIKLTETDELGRLVRVQTLDWICSCGCRTESEHSRRAPNGVAK